MLAFLPLLTLLGLWGGLMQRWPGWGWRHTWLRAMVLSATYMVLVTEGLSLLSGLTRPGLVAAWAVPSLALWPVVIRSWAKSRLPRPQVSWPGMWSERLVLLAGGLIVGITALLAWHAPPSTWDALNYHVARVAHWAQQASLRHYPTGIEIQNSRPPGAEVAILHLFVLGNGDRLANFVEWTAMLGSLVGVTLLAQRLGAEPRGQLLAAGVAVSIPMGIVQAFSTMNDYVVALWCVCAAVEVLEIRVDGADGVSPWMASLAAGLAVHTKPTAIACLLPLAVLGGLGLCRQLGGKRAVAYGVLAFATAVMLNLGPWLRNLGTYGAIHDPHDLARHANQWYDPRAVVSNLARNLSLHAGTPWRYVNKGTGLVVLGVHRLMGVDANDPRTTAAGDFGIRPPATEEDWVGNPLHAVLGLVTFGLAWGDARCRKDVAGVYGLGVACGFVLFSLLYRWSVFGSRLQLPLFVLASPVVGVMLERHMRPRVAAGIVLALMVMSWPWLVSVRSRPLVARPDSLVGSVLVTPRHELYFANAGYLRDALESIAGLIQEARCPVVGIALSGNAPEYLVWVTLGAPRADLRVAWIVGGTPSARYEDPTFTPCAVICDESCPADWSSIRGLPLAYERAGYRLYLGGTASP